MAGDGFSAAGLLWPRSNAWPPEIDFFEVGAHLGSRQLMYVTNHYLTAGVSNKAEHELDQAFIKGNFTTWHTVSTRWSASSIRVYVDGILRFSETDPAKIPM